MEILSLTGPLYSWTDSVWQFKQDLSRAAGKDIQVNINSPGGVVTLGIELYNLLDAHTGAVNVNIIGRAASMATYVALAGDKISVQDNAIFMIHNASGVAIGDYRTMRKLGNLLDSFTDLIARKYVQRTGKTMVEIRKKMDDETYFFGEDIKKYGFADEVVTTGKKPDQKKATAEATLEVAACIEEMKKHEISNDDMQKIAAHVTGIIEPRPPGGDNIPETQGNNEQQEDENMSLQELMATDSGIKAEVDALVSDAKKQGYTAGKEDVEKRIEAAAPFIGGTEYPQAITNLAVGVVKGEKDPTALEGAVVAFDAMKEQAATTAAGKETDENGETPGGDGGQVAEDGSVSNEADYQASIAKVKGGK